MHTLLKVSASAAFLVLVACSPKPAVTVDTASSSSSSAASSIETVVIDLSGSVAMSSADAVTASSVSSAMASSSPATQKSSAASAAAAHVVPMTVENFAFSPASVTFKKGEKAVIRLRATTGIHGIGIQDLGINVRIEAGQTVDIAIPTDAAGTFSFRCTIPCGPGHKDMVGTIIIQ